MASPSILTTDTTSFYDEMETDYLTCGRCLQEFPLQNITVFIHHKKLDCNDSGFKSQVFQHGIKSFIDRVLQCSSCPQGFMTARGLLKHAQITHNIRIFVDTSSSCPQTQQSLGENYFFPVQKESLNNFDESAYNTDIPNSEAGQVRSGNMETPCRIHAVTSDGLQPDVSKKGRENNMVHQPDLGSLIDGYKHKADQDPKLTLFVHKAGISDSWSVSDDQNILAIGSTHQVQYDNNFKQNSAIPPIDRPLGNDFSGAGILLSQQNCEFDFIPSEIKQESSSTNILVNASETVKNDKSGKPVLKGQIIQKQREIIHEEPAGESTLTEEKCKMGSIEQVEIREDTSHSFADKVHSLTVERTKVLPRGCCNNQTCGVTVIPGTHECLKKCCSAVVPKKRKCHFETKHMCFSSHKFSRRRSVCEGEPFKTPSEDDSNIVDEGHTIYIDVKPEEIQYPISSASVTTETISSSNVPFVSSSSNCTGQNFDPKKTGNKQRKSRSVILKPGAVISIPFSYAFSPVTSSVPPLIPESLTRVRSIPPRLSVPVQKATMTAKAFHSGETVSETDNRKPVLGPSTAKADTVTVVSPRNPTITLSYTATSSSMGSETVEGEASDTSHTPMLSEGQQMGRRRKYPTSRPFKCDVCTLAFNQRIHLKKHMSKHTGIKPFKCQQCDYSTVERSHLKVHFRIHTGEKPFKCTHCEYATAQNSTLKIHQKRHHGNQLLQWKCCQKTFTQQDSFKLHQIEHKSSSTTGGQKEQEDQGQGQKDN
ncbi:hypothetical protein CHS0354_031739 [Potamilus streckersoni]|uniref:C2H2-type domain-containing protein n=1 Tax=Potamilus streckersoni TaxID=2493646 RepID=A0AAE0VY78_9BIVA|nr:hypothetical protein CHS0354_031739 [Potamilus streckersoni]